MSDKQRAKQIIAEIIRLHLGEVPAKASLCKAFYFAHLYYAKDASGYLSDWPIVKAPNGPGIQDADELLGEMVDEGVIEFHDVNVGPYNSVSYRLVKNPVPEALSPVESQAIRAAVDFVREKTGGELSHITQEFSRSWRMAADGDELNIYIDLEPEDQFLRRMQGFKKFDRAIAEAWPAVQT